MIMLKTDYAELETLVDREIGPSGWIEVSQDRIDTYADAVSDHNWIHVDRERAGEAFGGTIAHGLLVLSLAPPMAQEMLHIGGVAADLNYGFEKVRFVRVVKGGDRVRLWLKVLKVSARGGGKLLRMEYRLELEEGLQTAIVADWAFLLFPETVALAEQAFREQAQ